MDNWQECTQTCRGVVSRRMVLNTQMGLGHDRFDPALGAWVSDYRFSESNHRQFYRRWSDLMQAGRLGRAGRHECEGGATMPDADLIRDVEQFLFREARLLDERRFHDWLRLFTDDVHYWMSARANRYPKIEQGDRDPQPGRYVRTIPAGEDELGLFDEDYQSLTARVARLDTGMAWAEDPPSRHTASDYQYRGRARCE